MNCRTHVLSLIFMLLTFGEKIRLLRENAELSQSQLGKAVNMTQRKISYIEQGKYEPGLDDIRSFCLYFNVSADYLLGYPKQRPFKK